MWDRPASEMAMAPSPEGRYLFVVDAALGVIAVMDTESLRVRSGDVDLRVEDLRRTSAQLGADGETLYVATSAETSTITAIDVRTFDVLDRWDLEGDVTGLGLSGDGGFLLAATAADGLMFDPATGEEIASVTVRTPEPVDPRHPRSARRRSGPVDPDVTAPRGVRSESQFGQVNLGGPRRLPRPRRAHRGPRSPGRPGRACRPRPLRIS